MARVALVTGGSRGIGAAISIALKEAGNTVIATYAGNDEKAKAFTDEHGIPTYKFDVGDYDQVAEAVGKIAGEHGDIEILVNNAGITRDGFFHKMTREQWQEVIKTNLDSLFNLCHVTFPTMRANGFGRIINISSINGQVGQAGQVNYSAAKAGVIGFSKALAQEGAFKGVTVNTICPGYINTDMMATIPEKVMAGIVAKIPVGRLGEASEIARGVVFLASDDAGFVTGATLSLNGGQAMM